MLIVQRKVGEKIVIGGGIEITLTAMNARSVRIGVKAPRGVLVLRGEVHDAIVAANAAAVGASTAPPEPAAAPKAIEEATEWTQKETA
jgi:carbon storage regulator